MAIELIRFLGGTLVLLIPGICLARVLSLGENLLERFAIGCSLGLAMAVYIASVVSHIDLRGFYPAWGIIALVSVIAWLKKPRATQVVRDVSVQIWMILILLVVAISRFAMALPLALPPGPLDPTFHLVLAKQIQITHHAIDRWPFANIPLNYPTGSHVLLVVLSALSGLPLHTVFKDLIPLLGVLSTAQMYVFARRMTASSLQALYSAAIYGLWAWFGSIDYFRWGGLPNELAMLLFVTMLSVCGSSRGQTIAMTIYFAAAVLVHHHVMVVSVAIVVPIILWQVTHRKPWRSLAVAMGTGFLLDAFFLLPYAMHVGNFRSTGMVAAGEPLLPLHTLPGSFGYALVCFAAFGIVLCLLHKSPCHPVVAIASLVLIVMFVTGEDIIPLTLRALHRTAFTFFTPSRFLTDLNYFLPVFAAGAILFLQRQLRFPAWIAMLILLIAPLLDYQRWVEMFTLYNPPPQWLDACGWIQRNTPQNTLVHNTTDRLTYPDDPTSWLTYLCWREPAEMALPVSEPLADYHPAEDRIPLIISRKIPHDPPGLMIVKIGDARSPDGKPILWQDASGAAVFREWP